MEDQCVGSQPALQNGIPASQEIQEFQGNFSYLALLRGDIDISSLTDTTNQLQGDTRSFSSSANNDTGKMVVGTRFQHEACTTEVIGENSEGASASKNSTAQNADRIEESNNWNENVDDNPWDANLFDDMHLDEIEEEYNTNEDANRHETDHTWNLDAQNDNLETDVDTSDSSSETMAASKEKASGDIDEEDVENFLEDEKEASEQPSPNTGVSAELMPEKGMQFKSRNEAQQFLNNYSFAAGFSIAVVSVYRTTSKKRNNEVTRVTIKCNKHGHNTADENEQLLGQRQGTVFVRTDCKVEMVISEKNGVWRITNLKLEHNHPLDPGSRSCQYQRTSENAHNQGEDQAKNLLQMQPL
ncbi:unnamed protein product [Alopecurus aequalis]